MTKRWDELLQRDEIKALSGVTAESAHGFFGGLEGRSYSR